MTHHELNSFITYSINESWLPGLKAFLQSTTTHFFFLSMNFDEQKIFIERIIKLIKDVQDLKVKRSFFMNIIEDIMTKRPYVKHFTLHLLEGGFMGYE